MPTQRSTVFLVFIAMFTFGACSTGGISTPEGSNWVDVEVGWDRNACGLEEDGTIFCWGPLHQSGDGAYQRVSAGEDFWGLDLAGIVHGPMYSPIAVSASTAMVDVQGTLTGVCAVDEGGAVWCDDGETPPSLEPLNLSWHVSGLALTYSDFTGCTLGTDGTIRCLSHDGDEPLLLVGEYSALSSSESRTYCALEVDGGARCWDREFHPATGSEGPYLMVDVGGSGWPLACGVLLTGEVECWGPLEVEPDYDEFPAGDYTILSVGSMALCGVQQGGTLACVDHEGFDEYR